MEREGLNKCTDTIQPIHALAVQQSTLVVLPHTPKAHEALRGWRIIVQEQEEKMSKD